MSQAKRPAPLWRALGEELRRRREAGGHRQDEIATVARSWGLSWTRSVVAAIEAGRRRMTVEEVIVLPWIAAARDREAARQEPGDVTLSDLVGNLGPVLLTPVVHTTGSAIRRLLEGNAATVQAFEDAAKRRLWDSEWARLRRLAGSSRSGAAAGTIPAFTENLMELAAEGEAERKAAIRLRTSPLAVSRAAFELWGRSFTAERDRRVTEERSSEETSPRTLQAVRGHIARALLRELREHGIPRRRSKKGTGGRQ